MCPTLDRVEDVADWADPVWAHNTQMMLEMMLRVRLKRSYPVYIGHHDDTAEMRALRDVALKNDLIEAVAPAFLSREQAERLYDFVRLSKAGSVYSIVERYRDRSELLKSVFQGDQ